MSKSTTAKKKSTSHAKQAASAQASQTIIIRNMLFGLLGLGIMLMMLSRFNFSSEPQHDSFAVPIPPIASPTGQLFTDSETTDYNMNETTTVASAADNPLLEENIEASTEHTASLAAQYPHAKWHEITIKSGDNLTSIFNQYHLGTYTLQQITQVAHASTLSRLLKPGNSLRLFIDEKNQLLKLMYVIDENQTLIVSKLNNQYQSEIQHRNFHEELTLARGKVGKTLKETLRSANISELDWLSFARIFSDTVDFRRDLRVGDKFEIIYNKYRYNDNSIRRSGIIAAKLKTRKQTYTAIYFESQPGKPGHYYNPQGESIKKSFDRSPVRYHRISDHFDPKRYHPILRIHRPHNGVDLAAARGTPIKAVGDGYVKDVGLQGGYGKVVELNHSNGITTVYAHMSRFAKSTKKGAYVKRGQVIGYVGSTGLATGPHVHYEYRVNDIPKDPMKVKLPKGHKVPESAKTRFAQQSTQMLAQFDQLDKTTVIAQR